MRTLIGITAFLLLAGCESDEEFWRPYHYVTDHYLTSSAVPDEGGDPSRAPPNAHCVAVAQQRARDATANGYDNDIVAAIYRGSYRDCAAWDAQHAR